MGPFTPWPGLTYNIMFSTSKVLSMTVGQLVMIGGVLGAFFIGICNMPIWLGALAVLACGGRGRSSDISVENNG